MAMDATPNPPADADDRPTPDRWADIAELPARTVAREHSGRWSDTGLPDTLADLDAPLETVWAAVQLALSGADQHTLAHTLGLTDAAARQIIVAATEQLLATDSDADEAAT
ncbi:hypothetical protein [Pseudonocardia acidicola]|uniref:Sigma-70-like protein n=1 Tax=Pseudonocardia acidicola TaxID=2724939 RepID=A0ABX1SCN1_9PSEU|nr:hypothetical protein [Pseudonocardia acidicola]NMH99324.1 hypothetical protein [Pseudonocardia acidicola]